MQTAPSRSTRLLELRQNAVPRGVGTAHPIVAAQASGALLWDVDAKEYIDFVGGIGVLNVGHSHPKVGQAVKAQLERLTHTCFQVAIYEPYLRLAERLNALAPGASPKKTILLTTGAEAVENAIKIARAATGRQAVIAFHLGFHGRTLLGMSLTGKAHPYRQSFGPFAPEIYHAPYPYTYRGWNAERALEALRELFLTAVAPDRVAAIIIEPVLGEGGFVPAPPEFLRALRDICDEYGILLIADEIQSGFGRTGKLFAIERAGIEPDLITVAKSLAAGLPLSAVIGRADVMDAPDPGGLGGTYAGNPLACAAALAVLDVFAEEDMLERALALGQRMRTAFESLQDRHAAIGDVRGQGPMLALELVKDQNTREPAPEIAAGVVREARERGLLLLTAGLYGNVIRVLVPLVIENEQLHRALAILDESLTVASGPPDPEHASTAIQRAP